VDHLSAVVKAQQPRIWNVLRSLGRLASRVTYGAVKGVASQACDLRRREISVTPFDCPVITPSSPSPPPP
jgi:hypothetical protein